MFAMKRTSTGSPTSNPTQIAAALVPTEWRTVREVELPPGWTTRKLTWYWVGFRDGGLVECREGGEGGLLEWRRKEQQ